MDTSQKYELDMSHGPLVSKIIIFSIPMLLTGILQLLYNAVNIIVVGRYMGSSALAAVGSTTVLTNLIINLFIGLSVGSGVVMAKHYGAGRLKDANETVHTAVATSAVSGLLLMVFGLVMAKSLLKLMGTPVDVLDYAVKFMRVYFIGMPASMIFNFSSSILRAVGDTRRPLYFLTVSGIANILLNFFMVLVLHTDVAGVALATVISQYISAILILICLVRSDGCVKLNIYKVRFYKDKFISTIKIGIPAGIQGVIFALSNVLIQSTVNGFGSVTMAGNAAALNIEGFVYISMNSVYQAAINFTSQNVGAKKFERIGYILRITISLVTFIGIVFGGLAFIFGRNLLGIYSSDPNVISVGLIRISHVCVLYFVCGIMDVMVGILRGMGYAILPMLVSIVGVCGIRITWIYTVFKIDHRLETLYYSYISSWAITAIIHFICYLFIKRKLDLSLKTSSETILT